VALKLIYLMSAKLLSWMVLRIRSGITKDIEIFVVVYESPNGPTWAQCHMGAALLK